MMKPSGHRKFWALFVLSIALHATLFAVMSGQRQHAPVALPPILASIRLIAVSESGSVAAVAPSPAPATILQKVRQNPQRTEQRSALRVVPTAGPANAPAQSALPQVVAAAESGAAVAVPSTPSVQATPVAASLPQSELLDSYRQRLGQLFARHQEYPRIAALRGWEGEVRLRLKVARKGNLLGVQLDRSSGFEVLDQHALAMLEALASLPPLPDALESNEIQVVVPINYKLKKTT